MRALSYIPNVVSLELYGERCTGCGMCPIVCPHAVLAMDNGKAGIVDRDACMECGACSRNCPADAISVQAGVGCAQAVINTALGRSGSSCCTLDDQSGSDEPCGSPSEKDPCSC